MKRGLLIGIEERFSVTRSPDPVYIAYLLYMW
jgi:hypothetical protein